MSKQTSTSRLGEKVIAYFRTFHGFELGQTVVVVDPNGWNGHPQGETGVLVPLKIKTVFGRKVNTVVMAVRWHRDGRVDWGMHMNEKLQVAS